MASPSITISSGLSYDLVVIGGGSAGLTAAKFATTFGKSAVIIEKAKLGGDCTWTGCVPSKALLKSASIAHAARTANKYGVKIAGEVTTDMKEVMERVKSIQEHIYEEDDSIEVMKGLGVDTIEGSAFFDAANVLKVTDAGGKVTEVYAKEGVVIASGAKPIKPDKFIDGLDSVKYITYEEVFDLDYLPKKMTIVGGGPIGCELAQAFARLGSQVTQIASSLLPNDEPEAGQVMENVFEREGIKRVKGRLQSVRTDGSFDSGKHIATCSFSDGATETVEGDILLVAVGRAPNVSNMGLESVGVSIDQNGKGIIVDEKLRTSVKNIYAAGDCTGVRQFTHYAGYQGAIAARNILLPLTDPGLYKNVPACTFTEPEVSSVGLTESEAMEEYPGKVSVRNIPITNVDRAECSSESDGFIKVVYKSNNYEILGATIVSTSAGELISEIAVAMKTKLKFDQLATVMHAYPTYSFALQVVAAELYYEKLAKSKGLLNILKKVGL